MPPQSNSAVVDDEYGLESAKPAKAASGDDYGLEPANKTATPAAPEKPNFSAALANVAKSGKEFQKAAANQSVADYNKGLGENETFTEKMGRGHANVTDILKHGLNPMSMTGDASEVIGKIGDVAQQKSEEAKTEAQKKAAQGAAPGDTYFNPASAYDLAARTAHMASGATTPKNVAIAGGALVAPEIVGPALIAHGLHGTYEAGKDIKQHGLTPENTEAGLSSLSETAGGGAMTGDVVHGGLENTNTAKVLDKAVRGTPLTEAGKVEAATKQAMTVKRPGVKETDYAGRLQQALPDLQAIAKDNLDQIKTPRDAVQAIDKHIAKIEEPIGQHVRTLPNEGVNVVAPEEITTNVNKAIDDHVADPRSDHYSGKEVEKARQSVHDLIGDEPKSIADVERIRRRLNKDASDYYLAKKTGATSNVASDAEAAFKGAAADAMRDMLYGKETGGPGLLERAGVRMTDAQGKPVPLRAVRQQVGNLIDIRNHFRDAITRAEQTGDWSLFKSMGKGPSLAMGGLGGVLGVLSGGPVGAIVGTGLAELGKGAYDYQHTPNANLNTEKMFRNLSQTGGEPNIPRVTTVAPEKFTPAAAPATQQALPLPPPEASLFNIQQTPRLRPDVEEPRLAPIHGEQMPLGETKNGPFFDIQQTPRLRPDFEEPRLAPIHGEQTPLHIPESPEQASLFSIPSTSRVVPEQPRLSNVPKFEKANAPLEADTSGLPKPNFRGTAANVEPAENATAKISEPTKGLKSGESTADRFFDRSKEQWAPEREAMHTAIAEKAVAGKIPPSGRPPEATITVGGTGAGKTTVTRAIMKDDPNLVNVDSDANKLQIPEYEGLKKSDPQKAAARVHDESKAISKRIIQEAVGKGLDFVYDTSTGGGGEPLFKKLKDLGYNVKVVYADVPVEEAIKRADLRARESKDPSNRGRVVPEDIIRKKHAEAAKSFLDLSKSPSVDEVRGFDTTTRTPEEFYTRNKSGEKVANQKILDRVREKAGVHAGTK